MNTTNGKPIEKKFQFVVDALKSCLPDVNIVSMTSGYGDSFIVGLDCKNSGIKRVFLISGIAGDLFGMMDSTNDVHWDDQGIFDKSNAEELMVDTVNKFCQDARISNFDSVEFKNLLIASSQNRKKRSMFAGWKKFLPNFIVHQ